MNSEFFWKEALSEAQITVGQFLNDSAQLKKCAAVSEILINAYKNNGTIFSCGNGGSHCDAMHFAEEMTGRYRKDRRPLAALALGDASHVTCTSNDYGFKYIFSRQIEALGRSGDVIIGLSTSGNSENVLEAFRIAKAKGITTVGLLGKDGGKALELADLSIVIPAQTSDRIQEMHIKLIHTVIETVERHFFPEHYAVTPKA
jgi:D-sedoheptulose 7-phosphate isomerase